MIERAKNALKEGRALIDYIADLVNEILNVFRLPEKDQKYNLPTLLKKLRLVLEGHYANDYQPSGSKTQRLKNTGVSAFGGPSGKKSMQNWVEKRNSDINETMNPQGSIRDKLDQLATAMDFEKMK